MQNIKRTAMAGAIAAAFAPQHAKATITTVGGDGGVGSVTLTIDDHTNLGGVLLKSITYSTVSTTNASLGRATNTTSHPRLFYAYRSSNTVPGAAHGNHWTFAFSGAEDEGAIWNSADNWVPGYFSVNGVNSGNLIWGWLHISLGPGFGSFNPTILSFTYDNAPTNTDPFPKPVGGFQINAVPEPATFSLMTLALGAAGVWELRRRKKARQ